MASSSIISDVYSPKPFPNPRTAHGRNVTCAENPYACFLAYTRQRHWLKPAVGQQDQCTDVAVTCLPHYCGIVWAAS
jgi:hypothetical protein